MHAPSSPIGVDVLTFLRRLFLRNLLFNHLHELLHPRRDVFFASRTEQVAIPDHRIGDKGRSARRGVETAFGNRRHLLAGNHT